MSYNMTVEEFKRMNEDKEERERFASIDEMTMEADVEKLTLRQYETLKRAIGDVEEVFNKNFNNKIKISSPNPDYEQLAYDGIIHNSDCLCILTTMARKLLNMNNEKSLERFDKHIKANPHVRTGEIEEDEMGQGGFRK